MRGSYDSKGIEVGSSNVVAPAGEYSLRVKRVFDTDKKTDLPKKTRDGDPMVSVLCEIDDAGPYLGATVWHNVTFFRRNEDGSPRKGAGMALHFLRVIGEEWGEGGASFVYDTDRWIDRTFRAKLRVGKDMNGLPRNEIALLIDPIDQPSVPVKSDGDEVPF